MRTSLHKGAANLFRISLLLSVLLPMLGSVSPSLALRRATPGIENALAGRHDEAHSELSMCLAQHPEDLRCALFLAALREARGDYDAALAALVLSLEEDASTALAAGALARTVALSTRTSDGGAGARALFEEIVLGKREVDNPEVRALATLALADILSRQGSPEQGRKMLLQAANRPRAWTLLGPYGRVAPLALGREFAPETGDLDPSDDETDPGRRRAWRIDTHFADGRVLFPPSMFTNGALYAATDLLLDKPRQLRMRVASTGAFRVFLDGLEVVHADRYRESPPIALGLLLELGPGRHRLLIKTTGTDRFAPASLSFSQVDGKPLDEPLRFVHPEGLPSGQTRATADPIPLDMTAPSPREDDPAAFLASAWWLKARGLDREVGQVLKRAAELWPEAPVFSVLLGEYYFKAETGAAVEEDLASARTQLEKALAADPQLIRARLMLAEMEYRAGQQEEARLLALQALELAPGNTDSLLLLHRLASRLGWEVEAQAHLVQALAGASGRTEVLTTAADFYRSTQNYARLREILTLEHGRYPQEPGWADLLSSQGEVDEALAAWNTMIQFRETNGYAWLGKTRLLTDADRLEQALETLEQASRLFPEEDWVPYRRAGILALLDRKEEADESLRDALERAPGRVALRKALVRRGVESDRLARWLAEARPVLDEDSPRPGVDSALLADIAATMVDRQGGQTELYQGIHSVYTRAGVEHEGELVILPGSVIDSIRLHKKDRRILDVAPGSRRPVNLPSLAPGDSIEYVTRRYTPPLQALRGALDNRTFFLFQGEDRDYILSRFALVHPADLPVEICGNQEGLESTDTLEDGWRIRSWTARHMPRLYVEPHAPDRLEITPHVRLGLGLRWADIGDLFRGALIGKTRLDAPLPAMLAEIRSRAGSESAEQLARTMHTVINEKVRPGPTPLSLSVPASAAASAGEGNRIGIALALATELGLDPALILTRPMEFRGTGLDCPAMSVFPYALLRISMESEYAYLDYTEADHPFDTIPSRVAGSDGLLIPMGDHALSEDLSPELVDLPERETKILQDQLAEVVLGADGRVHGHLRMVLRGPFASVIRRLLREVPSDRLPVVYQTMAGEFFPGARVLGTQISGEDSQVGDLVLSIDFEDGSLARRTPSGFAIPLTQQPLGIVQEFASLPLRRHPMLFNLQAFRHDLTLVTLPEGLEVQQFPEGFKTSGRWGEYQLSGYVSEGVLHLERTVNLPPQRVETEDYLQFREFALELSKAEGQEVLFFVNSPSLSR